MSQQSKNYPEFSTDNLTLTDTLVLSRLIRADLMERDIKQLGRSRDRFPKRLLGYMD